MGRFVKRRERINWTEILKISHSGNFLQVFKNTLSILSQVMFKICNGIAPRKIFYWILAVFEMSREKTKWRTSAHFLWRFILFQLTKDWRQLNMKSRDVREAAYLYVGAHWIWVTSIYSSLESRVGKRVKVISQKPMILQIKRESQKLRAL